MRIFLRLSNQALHLSSQTFCETEDILELMEQYVKTNGLVDTLYVEYLNMKIPICDRNEFRIVAQMAAAYNNSIIEENLRCQRDLANEPYIYEAETKRKNEIFSLMASEETLETLEDSKAVLDTEWNEELHGVQVVYDKEYEQNEDLIPWLLFKEKRAQKFGDP